MNVLIQIGRRLCARQGVFTGLPGNKIRLSVPVLCILPLLLTACFETEHGGETSGQEVRYTVKVAQARLVDLPLSFELNGRVYAYARADVRPQVGGLIKERLFTEGSQVKKGQPLYQLDDALYQADYLYARAQLSKASDNKKQARLDYLRYQELFKHDAASRQQYEDKRLAYALAQDEEELAKASLLRAQAELDYTKVRAPISGTIGKSAVTPGALVTANQEAVLASIIDLSRVYVDVQQSGVQWRNFKQGLLSGRLKADEKRRRQVSLFFEDGSRYAQSGTYSLSEVEVDESSGSVTLRAVFDNQDGLLLPGMAVKLNFGGPVYPDALIVPATAVSQDTAGRSFVYTIEADNTVQRRQVQPLFLTEQGWVIAEGLKPLQQLALSGAQKLKSGMKVAVEQEPGMDAEGADSAYREAATFAPGGAADVQ